MSSVSSSLPPVTPDNEIGPLPHIETVLAEDSLHPETLCDNEKKARRRSRRHGMVIDHDIFSSPVSDVVF